MSLISTSFFLVTQKMINSPMNPLSSFIAIFSPQPLFADSCNRRFFEATDHQRSNWKILLSYQYNYHTDSLIEVKNRWKNVSPKKFGETLVLKWGATKSILFHFSFYKSFLEWIKYYFSSIKIVFSIKNKQ